MSAASSALPPVDEREAPPKLEQISSVDARLLAMAKERSKISPSSRISTPREVSKRASKMIQERLISPFTRWLTDLPASTLSDHLHEGDIILFGNRGVQQRCVHCLTKSEYDHVGLVVMRARHGGALQELCVLESTIEGVGHIPLRYFVDCARWEQCRRRYSKVAVRRLAIDGGKLQLHHRVALRGYVNEMLGRQYNLSPAALAKAYFGVTQQEDLTTVFCSELVAGAYKAMGLLPSARAAASWLPADFSQAHRSRLGLCGGAHLSREAVVRFDAEVRGSVVPARLSSAKAGDDLDHLLRMVYVAHLLRRWARRRRERSIAEGRIFAPPSSSRTSGMRSRPFSSAWRGSVSTPVSRPISVVVSRPAVSVAESGPLPEEERL